MALVVHVTAGPSNRGSTPPTTELPPPYGMTEIPSRAAPIQHVDHVLFAAGTHDQVGDAVEAALQVARDVAKRLAARMPGPVDGVARAQGGQRCGRGDPRRRQPQLVGVRRRVIGQVMTGQHRRYPRARSLVSCSESASSTVPQPHHERMLPLSALQQMKAPPATSMTSAEMAQPAPASHQMTPPARARRHREEHYPGFCLITASALFARIGSISLPGMPSECQTNRAITPLLWHSFGSPSGNWPPHGQSPPRATRFGWFQWLPGVHIALANWHCWDTKRKKESLWLCAENQGYVDGEGHPANATSCFFLICGGTSSRPSVNTLVLLSLRSLRFLTVGVDAHQLLASASLKPNGWLSMAKGLKERTETNTPHLPDEITHSSSPGLSEDFVSAMDEQTDGIGNLSMDSK